MDDRQRDLEAREKLLKKARLLAGMTEENGCLKGEAENAARMLAALMDEHDIGLDEVRMKQSEFNSEDIDLLDEIGLRVAPIRDAIATLTGTRAWSAGAGSSRVTFFGRDSDVVIAGHILRVADRAVRTETKAFSDRELRLFVPVIRRRKRTAFIDGMATAMRKSIENINWVRAQERGTGLIILKQAAVDAEIKRREIPLSDMRSAMNWDFDDSFSVGHAKGAAVTFDAAVGSDGGNVPLLIGQAPKLAPGS